MLGLSNIELERLKKSQYEYNKKHSEIMDEELPITSSLTHEDVLDLYEKFRKIIEEYLGGANKNSNLEHRYDIVFNTTISMLGRLVIDMNNPSHRIDEADRINEHLKEFLNRTKNEE